MTRSRLTIVAVTVLAAGGVLLWTPGPIGFRKFSPADFMQQLTPLLLVALLIERSLEVFLTTWRGEKASELQRNVEKAQSLVNAAPGDPALLLLLHKAQDDCAEYRAGTQKIALPAALVLGILIGALGIRTLGNLIDGAAFNGSTHPHQHAWFTVADVLLTGALVGGGSDVVHSFITAFTNFFNPSKP